MRKVGVLVVHGIGWHADGRWRGVADWFLTGLMDPPSSVARLEKALRRALGNVPFELELAHWGKELEPAQSAFEERYGDLDWRGMRRFVISALGDAAQYSAAVYGGGKTSFPAHEKIHAVVAAKLRCLADKCGPGAPLVLVGHSLGGHILSNHVYDEQKARRRGERSCHGGEHPLERMETLAAMITLGCNIPVFVMGTIAPEPIELQGARWVNYFDRDDVLGFPLRPLYFPNPGEGAAYALEDVEVKVGLLRNLGAGQTPLSHGYYWTNADVVGGIAREIRAAATRGA
jgi:hypothetical protein